MPNQHPIPQPETPFTPELLLPAGDRERLHTALLYGADAVYLGGKAGNLRAATEGFDPEALRDAVSAAACYGARIYYCLNALPVEQDMPAMPASIERAAAAGVHAFIIADPGVLRLARRYAPHIPVHISTQANTTNAQAVAFWRDAGACRVNLAREMTCRNIHAVRKALPDMELEVFLHGAMCLAVSGQCLLSAWLNGRSANMGRCTQPCRFAYRGMQADAPALAPCAPNVSLVVEEAWREGEPLWNISRNEGYSEFWAPDDLCLLPYLPWFITNRITSLKVEGRTKSSSYVAFVADAYRCALDAAATSAGKGRFDFRAFLPDLARTATRPLSTGFFLPHGRKRLDNEVEAQPRPLLARVTEPAREDGTAWHVEVRGTWDASLPAEVMLPGMNRPVLAAGSYAFENHRGEAAKRVNNGTKAIVYATVEGMVPGVFIRGFGNGV